MKLQRNDDPFWFTIGMIVAIAMFVLVGLAVVAKGDETSATADLKATMQQGLPAGACWNRGGFTPSWYAAQVKAGHRLVPTVRLPLLQDCTINNADRFLTDTDGLKYLNANDLPVSLTTENIETAFAAPGYRLPPVYENIPKSPLVWRQTLTGLDQVPVADRLADPALWQEHGRQWANSDYVLRLRNLLSQAAWLHLVENNELADDDLFTQGNQRQYVTKIAGKDSLGYPRYSWNTMLAGSSLRLRTLVADTLGPDSDPWAEYPDWMLRRSGLFRGLYAAFDEACLYTTWRGKIYSVGYGCMAGDALRAWPMRDARIGYAPMAASYDAASPGSENDFYFLQPRDFTLPFDKALINPAPLLSALNLIPAWEWLEAQNPRAFRELSVWTYAVPVAQVEPLAAWLLWSLHQPGRAMLLRAYVPHSRADKSGFTLPSDPCSDATYEAHIAALCNAADRICTNETLREFWRHGTPIVNGAQHPSIQTQAKQGWAAYPDAGTPDNRWRLLDCDCNVGPLFIPNPNAPKKLIPNPAARINVYACGFQWNGSYLICAWNAGGVATCNVSVPGHKSVALNFAGRSWIYVLGTPADLDWSEVD